MTERDLFRQRSEEKQRETAPLADRLRPRSLGEFVGQEHILGQGKPLRLAIESGEISSLIFWGPPGTGKTTLAHIVAASTGSRFVSFSAVLSGVKEIREVISQAEYNLGAHDKGTVLFVDEIHRFNKAQQDAFLPHVERGTIVLIGATTENPSFEVISALLSRCKVYTLQPLTEIQLLMILKRALADEERGLGKNRVAVNEEAMNYLAQMANGDARIALNNLEFAVMTTRPDEEGVRRITLKIAEEVVQRKALLYDKGGEEHYNIISALHKSLRGSDPHAALYWLGRMLAGGEDPLYIARRMIRFASEDIGNADPQALQVALSAKDAYHFLGSPEGELALAQAAVYLATAPKSNAVYKAMGLVRRDIETTQALPVPLHIRNAPTSLMRNLGYGEGYKYAHDYEDHYVPQEYLPDNLKKRRYYYPTDFGFEREIKKRMKWWESKKRAVGEEKKEKKEDEL